MRHRAAAAILVATALTIGAAGCAYWTPVATLEGYNVSDGVSGTVGDLSLDNVLLVTAGEGDASLVFTGTNLSDESIDLQVSWDAVGEQSLDLPIEGQDVEPFGRQGEIVLEGVDAEPGSVFPLYFQYGDEEGVELQVPVLDGTLPEYSTAVPAPPVASPTPEPVVPVPTPGIDSPAAPTAEPGATGTPQPSPTATFGEGSDADDDGVGPDDGPDAG